MSGRRFELLLSIIHLIDDQKMPSRDSPHYDKLYKIRPLLNKLVTSFQEHYTPHQNLSVDESIVGFKGRLSWVQYMPKKPTKWGIKTWTLVDATNGYVWNLRVYTGK